MSDQDVINGLRRDLADALRENEILLLAHGHVTLSVLRPSKPPLPPSDRVKYLEYAVAKLDDTLAEFCRDDCYGYSETTPCDCRTCYARIVRGEVHSWRFGGSLEDPSRRFYGARHRRTENGWNPREAKIHAAWVKWMGDTADHTLAMILSDEPEEAEWPSARDWYVATSIVQWLATNCGMSILQAAGFEYSQWDEDRKSIESKRQSQSSSM